jgi:lysophospholipase L1-like esterase
MVLGLALSVVPAVRASPVCGSHWVGAWAAVPTDASRGSDIGDVFAPSSEMDPDDVKQPLSDATVRSMLTPSVGGSVVRVHLSNRFGTVPATFAHVTIGKQGSRATLVSAPVPVTFGGKPSTTLAPGADAVSDPVAFSYAAFDTLGVSVYVANDIGLPTEHYQGRQTSFFTANGVGDHAGDQAGDAFAHRNTTRPLVSGLDVRVAKPLGAVVAFGDSITDGYQGQAPAGVPESPAGVDANGRWPDVLGRRLRAAGLPLAVVNAGISGNRVLRDGVDTPDSPRDHFGPAALKRLDADVLAQPGATTVIWLEGINDLGQTPTPTTDALIAGYTQGIQRMHEAGLRVLMGTLTPSGGNVNGNYGKPETEAARQKVNAWIRTNTVADGFVDFDAVVRNPSDPTRIDPQYDGGDHLHLNLAGYKKLGEAIDLAKLALPICRAAARRLAVRTSRRHILVGRSITLRIVVRRAGMPVRGALVRLGRFAARTNASGVAHLRVRFTRPGRRYIVVGSRRVPVRVGKHPR